MTTPTTLQKTFPLLHMSCAGCAARAGKVISRQPGVKEAAVNFATATATITYDPATTSDPILRKAVQDAGYDLIIETEKEEDETRDIQQQKYNDLKKRTIRAILLSVPTVIIGMFFMNIPYAGQIMWLLSTPVIFWLGRNFFTGAWKQLRHRSANMDTLVALSTGIAYLLSLFNLFFPEFWLSRGIHPHVYFEAVSVIITFILLGRVLEERARANTSSAIKKLMGLQPRSVTILTADNTLQEIPVAQLTPGNIVVVKPGEKIAVDGTVCEGNSYVDESMLSGESIPVPKEKGSPVFAGTINQKGSFRFRAEKVGSHTLLSQIIHLVQQAQGSKAPVQKLVDQVAAIFVPAILAIALLALAAWLLLDPANGITHGILALVTVLIIACPCALGLATPTAIIAGIGKGAENGILIRDAESLETARQIDTVVLDKTGTLTRGEPVLTHLIWLEGDSSPRSILYSLEKLSEHPLADAVVNHLNGSTTPAEIDKFETIPGKGIRGSVDGTEYYAGNDALLQELPIAVNTHLREEATRMAREMQTVIWFTDNTRALAVAGITDRLKENSARAVRQLEQEGITVWMLTGDNKQVAAEIARQAHITHYRAEVLPADKATFVKELQAAGKKVAMVGDGINDSAALAQANLGIAMGQGSDIAMEAAGITLLSSDLIKIPQAIRLSRLTVTTIRQNLFWAFIYNLIAIPVAAGILYPLNGFLLNPMIAGAAMALSSVSVVTNSLLLKRRSL